MDVFRLNPETFMPEEIIEGYSSMIWTERYQDAGEFQMKTAEIEHARQSIPEGSLISLRDSREVMIVETHTIGKNNQEASSEATIVGRTFETFWENRSLENLYFETSYPPTRLTPLQQIMYYLWHGSLGMWDGTTLPDLIDNVVLSEDLKDFQDTGYPYELELSWDERYAKILDLIKTVGVGLRNVRPVTNDARLVTFAAPQPNAYTPVIVKTDTDNVTQLRVEVYRGVNRSRTQSENEPVVLSYEAGDLTDPQYLFSVKGMKNVAVVKADDSRGTRTFYAPGWTEETATGLKRRTLSLDATDGSFGPYVLMEPRIQEELAKHNQKAALFEGEISQLAQYKYGQDYFLGDVITVMAEYGFAQDMRVVEYIRTEDANGDRGYPSLVQVDP